MKQRFVRARGLHFPSPVFAEFDYFDDAILHIENGYVKRFDAAQLFFNDGLHEGACEHHPEMLLLPGLIDAHVHFPQVEIIASFGDQLLDWLQHYTFPAEAKFADEQYARAAAVEFVDLLLAHGTTTAFTYATSHRHSADVLFEAAYAKSMRLVAGKVMMDRNAPSALVDSLATGKADSEYLINKWHGRGRLGYAVTPRFAGTSTEQQLQSAADLAAAYPGIWVQTHLSENLAELDWLRSLYSDFQDYFSLYERAGLATPRSVFGHCIHLSDNELARLAETGGIAAFCPSSNLFLGSGLFPLLAIRDKGIPIAIGTDVGAGTSLSMISTLGDAYRVCQLQSFSLDPLEAFYMATMGNARVLHLDDRIGNFCAGKEADFVLLNPSRNPQVASRVNTCQQIRDELFCYMILGDERLIEQTSVSGHIQFQQEPV